MRMVRRALRLPRPEVGRAHLVEEQKGVEVIERRGGKGAVHEEAGAFARLDGGDDVFDGTGFHGLLQTGKYSSGRDAGSSATWTTSATR
jgi:hypothetical protein